MTEQRQRQGRTVEVAQQRRRRDDIQDTGSLKLAIPPEVEAKLKAEGRTARWANDEGRRLHRLTVQDDYDKVDGVDPVPVGVDKLGKPIMAHLLSKPTEFLAEDRAKAEVRRNSTEKAMLRGKVPGAPGQEPTPVQGQMGADIYVDPASGMNRGNQILE